MTSKADDPPCHSRACSIQGQHVCGLYAPPVPNEHFADCLAKNSYDEAKCRSQVDALYECCNTFYSQNGDDAKSASCPKPNLLRLKMKQRALPKGSK
ncbi:DUF1903-domain-containing protein [Stipitochalara longipes BDJ]|nr:DUF1903-domain-containing protein [Stipitochalara longipes BDJ]